MSKRNEEREVLTSIYDGDTNFSAVNDTTYQYKFVLNDTQFYLVEIQWPNDYPNIIPNINLDLFSNRMLTNEFKTKLKEKLLREASELIGTPMTYTLFEMVKEFQFDGDMFQTSMVNANTISTSNSAVKTEPNPTIKKEQLSKAQKRRQWDKNIVGEDGQKPRGWNWVDIVKHLSQTGGKLET
ncbi:unnamed protein product [Didymodactylos carnosus]|uniref:RWD domain-containing protein n=1 Tax=Didymodactylos carnosus TaxID=1234261 RepID=A0A814DBA0_9BILA|nr:unnamed protein product [Didymodactylos carnosus]CAF1214077.1 unnamed protein product [Didymodactylos carnosus]CAF3727642.1 unnamed protein product [Didymodactylos carnosus]CAF4022797.1 unnamed protein product [Didymodactylos carnosus]